MALLSGQRIQCLYLLDFRNMTKSNSGYRFRIGDLVKTSRPGVHQSELYFPAYAPDRRLCIFKVFSTYLEMTKELRSTETSLFISFVKPHKSVSRDTLSRWIKRLNKAGIDTNIFTPHSTRSA